MNFHRSYLLLIFLTLLLVPAGSMANLSLVISGRIFDVSGTPVKGAEVYVFDSDNVKRPADFISPTTTGSGDYMLRVPPGKYWLVAIQRFGKARFGPLGKDDRHSGDPISVDGSTTKTEITTDFTVMSLREAAKQDQKRSENLVRITGRILDSKGKPRQNIQALIKKLSE